MTYVISTDSLRAIDERPSRSRRLSLLFWVATVTLSATAAKGQTCEPHWSDDFPAGELMGGYGYVKAITSFDDDSGTGPAVYIGGSFQTADGLPLNHMAKLMPNNAWAPVADGTDGQVRTLVTFDDGLGRGEALYAGGYFDIAGGVSANGIAKWDGESWSPLGEGTDGAVLSLTVFDDGSGPALYVGGSFNTAGGASVNNIARWDGRIWSPLGAGLDNSVEVLIVFDDGLGGGPALYVGGWFDSAGGRPAHNIAKWDGKAWLPLGDGTNDTVRGALTVFDDGSGPALYAGGTFTEAGGVEALHIAKWDGLEWSPVRGGTDAYLSNLAVFDDGSGEGPALYACGGFDFAGGVYVASIARWDGQEWTAVGGGISGIPVTLGVFEDMNGGSTLFIGGSLYSAGEIHVHGLAKWDGAHWLPPGRGLVSQNSSATGATLTTVEEGCDIEAGLYVGGYFFTAGGVWTPRVARWNKGEWSAVGEGIGGTSGTVRALSLFDDGLGSGPVLYAGGFWFESDGPEVQSTAKWDGKTWSPLGADVNNIVRTMTVFDDDRGSGPLLHVAGDFLTAGGEPASRIATWNGTEWAPLAGGGANELIASLIVWDDGYGGGPALYAGGDFTIMSGDIQTNFIAKWDGVQWSPLGSGMDSTVIAMAAYDDGSGPVLYAGGRFTTAGGVEANGIARWDGKQWSALPGGGIDGPFSDPRVLALTVFDDGVGDHHSLFVSGRFFTAGGVDAKTIARWDGRTWSALGLGLHKDGQGSPPATWALEAFDDGTGDGPALFAGGEFRFAGDFSSQSIAKWIVCAETILGDLNGDGTVSAGDLLILLANWGPCDDCDDCIGDLNGDYTVGAGDVLILLANWG